MLATKGHDIEGKRAVVSGSGNVAIYTMEKILQFGGKIAACSDSSGYVVDEDGIDLALVKEIKEVRRERISEYVRLKGRGAHFIEEGRSEEHTSELQSLMRNSYAIFCLKKHIMNKSN